MKNDNIQVAIDVGTTKVCTLISKAEATGALRVIGSGTVPSRGMQKGIVSNLSEIQQEIQASIREAEVQAGIKVASAYVGITGSHVSYVNCRAAMDNRPSGSPIGSEDITQVIKACCAERTGPENKVLHVIPRDYGIDGNWGVHDPIGMYGSSLEVESHVVMADQTAMDNLIEALRRAGVGLRGLVLEPLASAESTLSRDEKDMGVVLVDIGGGTTDVSVFLEGSIWHTNIIPAAGFQVTRDISIAFTTFSLAAEEAKLKFGHAVPDEVDEREQVRLPGFGNQSYTQVSRRDFCSVISDRVSELLRMAHAEVGKAGLDSAPAGGLVLTGGTANLQGIRELAGQIWPGPVRTGMPASYTWVPKELDDPAFATALGLLLWDARHSQAAAPAVVKNKPARSGALVGSLFNRVTLRSQA